MRSPLVAVLLLTTVACGSLGDAALADSPPSYSPAHSSPAAAWGPYIQVVDDDVHTLPTFLQGGKRFVLGTIGTRYRLKIVNPTASRVEAVVSVDGLDAIDGRPASVAKRGYLVPARGEVTIEGWRTSLDTVAPFRFSSVRASYAARTRHDRNVGVIGLASFRERVVEVEVEKSESEGAAAGPPAPAPASAPPSAPAAERRASSASADSRPGLGTEYGEAHSSTVTEVPFQRGSSVPDVVSELWYDDREGLEARGIRTTPRNPREDENARRDRADAFPETRFAQPPP